MFCAIFRQMSCRWSGTGLLRDRKVFHVYPCGNDPIWLMCLKNHQLVYKWREYIYVLTSALRGVPIGPQGMVNWHPLATVWHPLESPGLHTLEKEYWFSMFAGIVWPASWMYIKWLNCVQGWINFWVLSFHWFMILRGRGTDLEFILLMVPQIWPTMRDV